MNIVGRCHRKSVFFLIVSVLFLGAPVLSFAGPEISGAGGSFQHGAEVTVVGSGFGNKSSAGPIVWDDCSGDNILDKWSGAWPTASAQPNSTPRYTNPINNVGLPHSNIAKYLAGRAPGTGSGYPNNVMVWKNRTVGNNYPAYSYLSWYQRTDP